MNTTLQQQLFPDYFKTVQSRKPVPEISDKGKTLTGEEELFASKILRLSEKQVAALKSFVTFVTSVTAETIVGKIDNLKRIKQLQVRDLVRETGDYRGGMCVVAKRNNLEDGHKLRYLHVVQLDTGKGEPETLEFGVDCLGHVLELTPAERVLIKGLNAWVTNSTYRWLMRVLGRAISDGHSASDLSVQWHESREYQEFLGLVELIDANISLAYPNNFKDVVSDNAEKKRLQSIGRATSALKSAAMLEENTLPVPPQLMARLRRAAYQIKANLK